jgi:hypothetical protein
MTKATYVKDFTVTDPENGGEVEMTLFKHEDGGMFAIDASFIDQVLDDEDPFIQDPLNSIGYIKLVYPEG